MARLCGAAPRSKAAKPCQYQQQTGRLGGANAVENFIELLADGNTVHQNLVIRRAANEILTHRESRDKGPGGCTVQVGN